MRRGNQLINVNAPKQRVILATLLLAANRVVLADELMERLWPDRFPRDARASLQTHLARLRRTLGDGRDGRRMIHTSPGGYLIEVATEHLDLLRYRSLLDQASRAETAGDLVAEAQLLQEALALWRGTALADIASDPLMRDEVPQLTEEWFRALHRRFDVELMLGNHAEIVADLRRLALRHPLRERLCGQLMIALFQGGQQVEALKAYASVAAVLRNEYGLDVGDELNRLHHAVLTGDLTLVTELGLHRSANEGHEGQARWATPRQLPVGIADFVGRADLMDRIEGALGQRQPRAMPIVTVTGPPGVGKTAMAVQLAHRVQDRFPDGQLFVRLGRTGERRRDPGEVLAELLEATGMSRSAIPVGQEQCAAMFRSRLADRRVLLVLDDVIDVEQVQPLLPGTPGCAVIITSRSMLSALAGTVPTRLTALTDTESVELLERLVGSRRIHLERKAVARIVAACGRLPLALRIAGARLGMQPLASLTAFADRLQDPRRRLNELKVGGLDVRHSLKQSYVALDPPARTAFRRLGLLPDAEVAPWTVTALTGEDDERLTDRLIEASLLEPVGLNAMDDPTYRLDPFSALYAAERAEEDDPPTTASALSRYVDTLLGFAVRAARQLPRAVGQLPPEPGSEAFLSARDTTRVEARPWKWLATERDRLFSAIMLCCRYGWHERAARLAEIVTMLAKHRDDLAALIRLSIAVRDAGWANGDQRLGWRAEHGRAMLLLRQGRVSESRTLLTRCVNALDRLEAWQELPHSLAMLAHVCAVQQTADEALKLAEQARALARSSVEPHAEILALGVTADIMLATGRGAEARHTLDRVLARSRELRETRFEAVTLNAIGWSRLQEGDLRSATRLADEARALAGVGDRYGRARPLHLLSAIALAQDRHVEAMRLAEDSRRAFARLGDAGGEAELTCLEGEIHLAAGRSGAAVDLLVPSLNRLNELGAFRAEARGARVLARAHVTLEDHQLWRHLSGRMDAMAALPMRVGGRSGAA
ncbi:AfsR/SARP family transcriptional regulator [Nonomuraea africana]|uniref:DNA-binding SARP family transcriptional activator n=1 Tax=Nonomuraea africana TaxID=46171 RepID=A0ABR9KIK0_9ACTN|nr:AfsR/SARP family transcriptional regulator [Nonomuraea africana]MBE1561843.1 DNA-binding SARP family transcriptional activator [Nonomuraea africana]